MDMKTAASTNTPANAVTLSFKDDDNVLFLFKAFSEDKESFVLSLPISSCRQSIYDFTFALPVSLVPAFLQYFIALL